MGKLIVGAFAAVFIAGAAATGVTYALVAAKAPDKGVEFGPMAPGSPDTVNYGTP